MSITSRGKILVVEDEVHLATGIRYSLEQENYEVKVAYDGPTALAFFEQDPKQFDLVILDLMLPGMSGYTVCATLRDRDIHTPIMILSARTLPEDRARGFDVGANQYLSKPFELEEFLARVKNLLLLSRRQTGSGTGIQTLKIYKFAAAEINFDTFEVRVNGVLTHLTQLEITLLQYFIEHPDLLITRDELLEKVWGIPGDLNTRAPDQFMMRLRKLFEPDPANPVHFLTIRNAGYRFIPNP